MSRPKLLDLFCCAGGAGMGYHLAGFDVVGVDLRPQPRYPFEFHQDDALEYLAAHWQEFDAIHASPPCQAYTDLRARTGKDYPDLLAATRDALAATGLPYVIENVEGAPLHSALWLCGSEFGLGAEGRTLRRHRGFESNVFLLGAGGCTCSGRRVAGVYGTGGGGQMTRGYKFSVDPAREAMGIDWMTLVEMSQAIPPAYTRFIGEQILDHLSARLRTAA